MTEFLGLGDRKESSVINRHWDCKNEEQVKGAPFQVGPILIKGTLNTGMCPEESNWKAYHRK